MNVDVGQPVLEVKRLKKYFPVDRDRQLKAVDEVSFQIAAGQTLGLVGESGCGKSTVGRTLLRLYPPTAGEVWFEGQNVSAMNRRQMKGFRRQAQMIFQDPYASLNARMTVGDIVAEGMEIHGLYPGKEERKERISEILSLVGLNREHMNRFPHEFSGGQRQRIGIARALAIEPKFIVADEPISALDVSVQAQVVNLLERLQEEMGLTFLFIGHDLSMVKHISDQIGVMYLGKIVEQAQSGELYDHALHPYTQALLSAIPIPDPQVENQRERIILKGDVPSPVNPPSGCRFRTRCPHAMAVCAETEPRWQEAAPDHWVACHLY